VWTSCDQQMTSDECCEGRCFAVKNRLLGIGDKAANCVTVVVLQVLSVWKSQRKKAAMCALCHCALSITSTSRASWLTRKRHSCRGFHKNLEWRLVFYVTNIDREKYQNQLSVFTITTRSCSKINGAQNAGLQNVLSTFLVFISLVFQTKFVSGDQCHEQKASVSASDVFLKKGQRVFSSLFMVFASSYLWLCGILS